MPIGWCVLDTVLMLHMGMRVITCLSVIKKSHKKNNSNHHYDDCCLLLLLILLLFFYIIMNTLHTHFIFIIVCRHHHQYNYNRAKRVRNLNDTRGHIKSVESIVEGSRPVARGGCTFLPQSENKW